MSAAPALQLRQTPDGLAVPLLHHDTEDPAELRRLVAAWEAANGPYTHVLFECQAGILAMPRPVTAILVPRVQPVLIPETAIDRTCVCEIGRSLAGIELVRAEDLPYFAWALVPLCCATNDPADLWRGGPMRKVGVNAIAYRAAAAPAEAST